MSAALTNQLLDLVNELAKNFPVLIFQMYIVERIDFTADGYLALFKLAHSSMDIDELFIFPHQLYGGYQAFAKGEINYTTLHHLSSTEDSYSSWAELISHGADISFILLTLVQLTQAKTFYIRGQHGYSTRPH